MLHACFTLLTDFVEGESKTTDWEADERHKKIWEELSTLYHWWLNARPNRTLPEMTELPDDLKEFEIFENENQNRPEVLLWRQEAEKRNEIENQWNQEDDAMLSRLIAVRRFLWS